ncbi:MAG TPA: helix-turn-helix domain-containing protein [Solirubrobacteraceae bacterium]|jgi:AcrR family transcriptional regulator
MARKSAVERREEIVSVAVEHFALGGYHGTSTEAIARDAGISQPYLFRLFGTKKELFLACEDRHHDFLEAVFRRAAAAAAPEERLEAMGHAYIETLLPDRHALRFQMQSYAACADPDIRAHVRRRYGELVRIVADLGGVSVGEVWNFFATGMLLNVVATLELETIADHDDWARAWTDPGELIDLSGS